ncbi:signal peptidase I [Patescibacteria group bacterium]
MGYIYLILTVIIAFILGILIGALILNIVAKLFKVANANYSRAINITILEWLVTLIFSGIVYYLLSLTAFINLWGLAEIVLAIVIFHILLKIFYKTFFIKNLGIYIVRAIFAFILTLLIVLPIRMYVIEPFYVKGNAMNPGIGNKDYLLFQKFDKRIKRGDIIVYKNPNDKDQFFIQRIIGLPNEKIEIKNNKIKIFNDKNPNGKDVDEKDYLPDNAETPHAGQAGFVIGENEYFVLADNRKEGLDSRSLGPIPKNLIVGKIWLRGWPLENFKVFATPNY